VTLTGYRPTKLREELEEGHRGGIALPTYGFRAKQIMTQYDNGMTVWSSLAVESSQINSRYTDSYLSTYSSRFLWTPSTARSDSWLESSNLTLRRSVPSPQFPRSWRSMASTSNCPTPNLAAVTSCLGAREPGRRGPN
jgi:hypothetical protein